MWGSHIFIYFNQLSEDHIFSYDIINDVRITYFHRWKSATWLSHIFTYFHRFYSVGHIFAHILIWRIIHFHIFKSAIWGSENLEFIFYIHTHTQSERHKCMCYSFLYIYIYIYIYMKGMERLMVYGYHRRQWTGDPTSNVVFCIFT